MAASAEAARLTEQQRQAQQQLRAEFLIAFLALWPLLDSERLDDTGPGWVSAVMALIRRFRLRSARIAARYYIEYRAAELPAAARSRIELPPGVRRPAPTPSGASPEPSPRPVPSRTSTPSQRSGSGAPRRGDTQPAPSSSTSPPRRASTSGAAPSRQETRTGDRRVRLDIDESAFEPRDDGRRTRIEIPDIDWGPSDRAARASVTVTGPIAQKKSAAQGKNPEQARKDSLVQASGAASRHVLTGGRQSLLRLAQDDMQVRGWVRVTDGDPCAFCAMLASRGVVFKEDSFAKSDPRWEGPGTVKVHDHCACTIEMVYTSDTVLPGRAAEFQKLWNDNIRNRYSGKEARTAWRRLYEAQQREQRDTGAA